MLMQRWGRCRSRYLPQLSLLCCMMKEEACSSPSPWSPGGSAAVKDATKDSTCFNPSSVELASPNRLTIALPTITPSAPHNESWSSILLVLISETRLDKSRSIVLLTCLTCSGFDMPKPTATGFAVFCENMEQDKQVIWLRFAEDSS